MIEIIAQIVGGVGMVLNLIVFQQKTHKGVLMCQFFAALVFAVSFFMLGGYCGAILNLVGAARSGIFYFKDKTHANSVVWFVIFILAFAASYPLTFFVFNTKMTVTNLIIEALPVIAMIIITISLRIGSAKAVRFMGLFSSPMWLIYNIFTVAITAIASEILNLISMVVGIIRFDIKHKQKTEVME